MRHHQTKQVDGFGGARTCALLLLAVGVLIAGCTPDVSEQEIGDELAASLLMEFQVVEDPVVQQHVHSIGMELVEVTERPEQPYQFYVVNSPVVNAFSLPGGHIFVTRALLQRTRSSAELAGVLAHEIAHVDAGHGVRRLQREMRSGAALSAINRIVFGERPAILDNPAAQLFDQIGEGLYSRADEREADRLAIGYMVDSGFHPDSFVRFLQTIQADEQNLPVGVEWLASHPSTESRIQLAVEKIDRLDVERMRDNGGSMDGHFAVLARLASLPKPGSHPLAQ